MPINPRPRTLTDVFTALFDQGQTPTVASPNQVVYPALLLRGGITTLGLLAIPSIVQAATYIAIGNGSGTPSMGDTALFHETGRAAVLPWISVGSTAIARALMPTIQGNGIVTEMGIWGGPTGANLWSHVMLDVPMLKTVSKILMVEWAAS